MKPNPFVITRRPFAVDPVTGIMLPDGIFDTTIGRLDIKFFIYNSSDDKQFDEIQYVLEMYHPADFTMVGIRGGTIKKFKPNSTVLVHFEADFTRAAPGEKELMIWISGDYHEYENKNHIKKIFVTKTIYDLQRKVYVCQTDVGNFEQSYSEVMLSQKGEIFNSEYQGPPPQIFIPVQVNTKVVAVVPFNGVYDFLPFKDPLWKVIAWLIAAIAALGGYIAARSGKGTVSIGINADDVSDGNYRICNPHTPEPKDATTLAGALSVIANAAMVVGLMHYRDPWIIGRESIALDVDEKICEEHLSFHLNPSFPIIAGQHYNVVAQWKYCAKTDKNRTLSAEQTQEGSNLDLAAKVEIIAPTQVHGYNPIVLGIRVSKSIDPDLYYQPDEIYTYCLLVSPSPLRKEFLITLEDNGLKYDNIANDGWFQGGLHLEEHIGELTPEQMTGEWTAYFFAQIVNAAPIGAEVEEATGYIGGNFIVSPLSLEKEPGDKCNWQGYLRKIGVVFP